MVAAFALMMALLNADQNLMAPNVSRGLLLLCVHGSVRLDQDD